MPSLLPVNPVKQRLQNGDVALGMNIRLGRSADIARIAKATGHDFIFLDTQHSIFNLETVHQIAQTALAIGIAPVVRVKSVNDPDVSLLLDNGVTGIVYPDVNTAADARRAVEICRFAPLGKRSVAGGYPHFDYKALPLSQSISELNDVCLLVCMVETAEGLANIEEICAVPGMDVIHMGTNDFAANIGKAGQFDDPELVAAQARVIDVARKHGKYAGCGGNRNVERQVKAIKGGAQFVTTQTDVSFLTSSAQQWTNGVRAALSVQA
ncbi:HpcH/HpaI aldolase family protein [Bordetella holmesii]|uniref:HpcH/HpaI aldolase/citrate lyase family protein n=2 Tax=Bordetella holmesii TaxID=35814 RepID=A0A158M8V2_9BORD|nr:aldolase/citrate lyase family protein [Bordetella holmesii]AHV91221.1 hpcH/HpaI aldolase/citrate lyase family protein [Bordetella holmesii ATCC 51541]AIT28513.1 hpcH/HpaI aldolase/citrate lyase family protein [Bordetella holmesii 44057]EWM41301.1 hpcH/HpaI aldolase/citrate lyase family protein [Bordetella holmesii 35009]EWM42931.1 hpcH/HpaI aldolase/citrate lyase family protein [Bordetella holmesii 41130]EWM45194.1 hpcH/HpaI aldolase/citrate lyase family protein [Bordetella holmesii 70147]